MTLRSSLLFAALLGFFLLLTIPVAVQESVITVRWVQSPQCEAFAGIAQQYPSVTVEVECMAPDQWYDQLLLDYALGTGSDIQIITPHFLDVAVASSYVLELTNFVSTSLPVDDYIDGVLVDYGEVPPDSGRLFAVPFMPDIRILAYREDIYMQADLTIPLTWSEIISQVETLSASELIPYGFATHWQPVDDLVATSWNHLLWSSGGQLWEPDTLTVDGVLNTEAGVEAIALANQLWETAPPGAAFFDLLDTNAAICNGDVAVVEVWYSSLPALTNPSQCEQASNIAIAVVPGQVDHAISIGGAAMTINATSPNADAAREFVAWFQTDDIQRVWVQSGGMTGRQSILADEALRGSLPQIEVFVTSFELGRDYWRTTDYRRMLAIQRQYLHLAITGQLDAQEALDLIAREQQAIIRPVQDPGEE